MRRRWSARNLLLQGLLVAAVVAAGLFFAHNAGVNLAKRSLTFGFDFLWRTAGFDIPFHIVPWEVTFTYGHALWVSFLNTILVSVLAIASASVLGLLLGIMRLSRNWLARNTALGLIEIIRNTPQLLQIVFWYVAVLQALPGPRQSLALGGDVFLNVRGLFLPAPELAASGELALAAFGLSLLALPFLWAVRIGERRLGAWTLLLPLATGIWLWSTIGGWSVPALQGFGFRGGITVPPELVALWLGLTIYAAGFIAEIVRAAIQGVPKGQTEAAASLGLNPSLTLFLVVLPQALRIMIPPLTSQYLNLIKSSSLGAAIAYPEVVQIFAGTVLNQSGKAIEVMLIVMGLFLAINLVTSALMNWYNRKVALVER
ncbi:MAG: ABC transporter permease subunit [Geminicoccaceae bacterium]